MKAAKLQPLSKHYKEKWVNLLKKYMETDFLVIISSDKHRATLNGLDDCVWIWILQWNRQHKIVIVCIKTTWPSQNEIYF